MSNEKSIVADKFDQTAKVEHISTDSKRPFERQRIDRPMLQNVRLIWLDNDIDNNNADCHDTITQFRHVVDTIDTFTDSDECVDFLTDIYNDNVCLIISDALSQNVVPLIQAITQLRTIFIYCRNKTQHEHWTADCPKVKGVFTEISSTCGALKQTANQCEQNAISFNLMNTSDDISKKHLDQLEPSFMYTQLLKDILLKIEFEPKHFTEFIDFCRAESTDNQTQLNHIDEFQKKYPDTPPICWYTRECFLYTMLNRALRLMDINLILKLGFFIGDLHRQIEQLHKEQFIDHNSNKISKVYRGQGLSRKDFDQMVKTMGGLISFNNFLSTSTDRDVAKIYAESNQQNPDLNFVGIIFAITVDPSTSSVPFAPINPFTQFQEEHEVLFSMHTIFRISKITPMDTTNRLFQVELTLTTDNDKDFLVLTERIRLETQGSTQWDSLGLLLFKLGQMDRAEQVYQLMLNDELDEDKKSYFYRTLGTIKNKQGTYNDAITFHEKSIEIQQRSLPSNHPDLDASYNDIGLVYSNMGEYSKAIWYYEKALEIQQQTLPSNHPNLAMSYNNIGLVYRKMGEYSQALSYYEKALEIQQQSLPSNHPDLAMSYNNIGFVYSNMGDYSKALSYYEKSLEIQQQSLPSNHPDLADSYNIVGVVYYKMGECSRAFWYYEKAFEIQQQSLPSNHPDLAMSYNNVGVVYYKMGEYSQALSYYEKALAIQQQSLSSNHPDLAMSYNNIGLVYSNMSDYSKALSYYEKALEIQQQSFHSNHPNLAMSYNNIGLVYSNMGDYSKALSYYEKSLEIQQRSLPSNHPDLAMSYNNVGVVYYKMSEYSQALSYYEKALAIQQQSLPSNHPDLAMSYNIVGVVYYKMGEYSQALSYYEKALEIQQRSLPSNHPDLAMSYNNIGGVVYDKMGDYSKALSYYEKSLAIQQELLHSNHPNLAMSYNNIGFVCSNMGDYSKALSYFEKALEIQQQSLPSNHPDLAKSYVAHSVVYNRIGEHSKSTAFYQKAFDILQQLVRESPSGLNILHCYVDNLCSNMGAYWKAVVFWELAIDIAGYSLPPKHPHLEWCRKKLGNVRKNLGTVYYFSLEKTNKVAD